MINLSQAENSSKCTKNQITITNLSFYNLKTKIMVKNKKKNKNPKHPNKSPKESSSEAKLDPSWSTSKNHEV